MTTETVFRIGDKVKINDQLRKRSSYKKDIYRTMKVIGIIKTQGPYSNPRVQIELESDIGATYKFNEEELVKLRTKPTMKSIMEQQQ